jgi:flavodoxin/Pyruvate/2-oxoacid:ferredoxin oxidoreductase delta subunit
MRSVIFYYSQIVTGNTKKIAEKIAEGLESNGNFCSLIPLTKFIKDVQLFKEFPFDEYDLIGLGVPVYYFHPPYHILFELKYFPNLNNINGFIFCTSGGNPGSTLYQIKKVLDAKGLKIIEGYDKWIGWDVHQLYTRQENSNGHYGWLPSSFSHPNEQELEEAKKFGRELIEKALDPKILEKTNYWTKENASAIMWSWKGIQKWFPKFKLIKNKCNKCGLCAQICPWDAIVLNPYPEWIKDCDRCYICDLKCPNNAINCDFNKQIDYLESLMKKQKLSN